VNGALAHWRTGALAHWRTGALAHWLAVSKKVDTYFLLTVHKKFCIIVRIIVCFLFFMQYARD
jgi:hypothetical protein